MTASLPATRLATVAVTLLLLWGVLHVNAVVYEDANQPVLRVPAEGPGRLPALREALASNPAHVGALLALGLDHDRAGRTDVAVRAFAAALGIAPVDAKALRVAAALDAREGRLGEAVLKVDRLLVNHGGERETAFRQLVAWLPATEARAALERLAAGNSPWMGAFVTFACGRDGDALLVAAVLSRRAAAGHARPAEVGCIADRLRRAGRWAEAYHLWLNTLPRERLAEVGFVFNGGFEYAPSGVGFDWIVEQRSPAHRVDLPVAPGAQGRRALLVTWTGKRPGIALRQYLALEPGRYELTGMGRPEGLQSVRGVQWVVRCADDPRAAPLGASPRFLGSAEWERFRFDVEVPARCAGQVLQLEPAGMLEGTTYVSGKAWFDDLRLARVN